MADFPHTRPAYPLGHPPAMPFPTHFYLFHPPNSSICTDEKPPLFPSQGHVNLGYYWVDCDPTRGVYPTSVIGGVDQDGSQIYVGRAYHEGDWIPAKVIPEKNQAYIAYGGKELPVYTYQLLCEQRFDWVPTGGGNVPPAAVEGGRTSDGETLYIGRVNHDGSQTVGKVHPSHGVCYIPFNGEEQAYADYEILILR